MKDKHGNEVKIGQIIIYSREGQNKKLKGEVIDFREIQGEYYTLLKVEGGTQQLHSSEFETKKGSKNRG